MITSTMTAEELLDEIRAVHDTDKYILYIMRKNVK
jgi:hypothetical protein